MVRSRSTRYIEVKQSEAEKINRWRRCWLWMSDEEVIKDVRLQWLPTECIGVEKQNVKGWICRYKSIKLIILLFSKHELLMKHVCSLVQLACVTCSAAELKWWPVCVNVFKDFPFHFSFASVITFTLLLMTWWLNNWFNCSVWLDCIAKDREIRCLDCGLWIKNGCEKVIQTWNRHQDQCHDLMIIKSCFAIIYGKFWLSQIRQLSRNKVKYL